MDFEKYTAGMLRRAEDDHKKAVESATYYTKRLQTAIENGNYSEAEGLTDTVRRILSEAAQLQSKIYTLKEVRMAMEVN